MSPGAVVVTGASRGIGHATARLLGDEGFRVFGSVRAEEDARRLEEAGVTPLLMDVTEARQVASAREEVEAAVGDGGLAGLVNNAGIPAGGPVELVPQESWRRVLEVNVLGQVRVTRELLPLLRRAEGRVVMMSSLSGRIALPFMGPYAASKFALEAISDSLRRELRPHGVDVTVIEPGPVTTEIWDHVEEIDRERFRGSVYEQAAERFMEDALERGRSGLPPEAVAREVHRALTARRPPLRRLVTRHPLQVRLFRLLPDRLVDRLTSSYRR